MDRVDLCLLSALEDGLPLVEEPFEEVGRRLGLTGGEVLERVKRLMEEGVIRKFRARINQRAVGITANALVGWRSPGLPGDDTGQKLASSPGVTHCYERRPVPGRWEYSLYTVHHGYSREEVLDEVRSLSNTIGVDEYVVLFSTEEWKRVPNVRIRENGDLSP